MRLLLLGNQQLDFFMNFMLSLPYLTMLIERLGVLMSFFTNL